MALTDLNIITKPRLGGADTDFGDKRRAEPRYQELQQLKRELTEFRNTVQVFFALNERQKEFLADRLTVIEEGLQAINSRESQLREQVQQWMMLVDGKIAQLMAQTAAAQDDRIPDMLARIARLETKRKPGRPKQAQQGG